MSFFLSYLYSCPPSPSPHPTGVDWPVNLMGNLHIMEGYVTFAGHHVHKALFDSGLLELSLNASGWLRQTYDGKDLETGQNCLGSALSSKSSDIQLWHFDSIIICLCRYVVKYYIVNSICIAITLINKAISPKRPQITVIFRWVKIGLIKE